MLKRKVFLFLSLALLMLSGCGPTYDDGYEAGYNEAELQIRDSAYEEGYETGYSDAEYEFYDSRFAEGYRQGYEDRDAGKDYSAAPRGDDYVWFSLVGDSFIYHKYNLPLPECATAQSTDGFADSTEYIEDEDSPCPICFPEQ